MATPATHAAAEPFPRRLLLAAALLIGFSIVVTLLAQHTGVGRTAMAPAAVVEQRALHFTDMADGGIQVTDAVSDAAVAHLQPGSNGFLRSVVRGLARERLRRRLGAGSPLLLTRFDDGRLQLADPVTGRHIALEAFGMTNARAFADLLSGPGNAPLAMNAGQHLEHRGVYPDPSRSPDGRRNAETRP